MIERVLHVLIDELWIALRQQVPNCDYRLEGQPRQDETGLAPKLHRLIEHCGKKFVKTNHIAADGCLVAAPMPIRSENIASDRNVASSLDHEFER